MNSSAPESATCDDSTRVAARRMGNSSRAPARVTKSAIAFTADRLRHRDPVSFVQVLSAPVHASEVRCGRTGRTCYVRGQARAAAADESGTAELIGERAASPCSADTTRAHEGAVGGEARTGSHSGTTQRQAPDAAARHAISRNFCAPDGQCFATNFTFPPMRERNANPVTPGSHASVGDSPPTRSRHGFA